jgi:mannosyltransferase OCH1-like enzyme
MDKIKKHIIILFFLLVLFSFFFINPVRENFSTKQIINISIPMRPIIPLYIYQTWETKDLPPKMKECVESLKQRNPEFLHFLYDDNDRSAFIKNNFSIDVYNAYHTLIPGAYKADLWRYCILYINGGIYLDIKFNTMPNFHLISLIYKEYFVRDILESGGGIYNAFLICMPKNQKLKNCIDTIVRNVQQKFYGTSALEITGPLLMKKEFSENELNHFEIKLMEKNCPTKTCVYWNNKQILYMYNEYREEQKNYFKHNNKKHYYDLWKDKQVYSK